MAILKLSQAGPNSHGPGIVALNSRVGTNGAVWGEDFVLSDTELIRPIKGCALPLGRGAEIWAKRLGQVAPSFGIGKLVCNSVTEQNIGKPHNATSLIMVYSYWVYYYYYLLLLIIINYIYILYISRYL